MASEEDLRRERDLEQIMQRRAGINTQIVDDLQDQTNVLNEQIRLLKFEKSERTQIHSLTREVNKIASENYNITAGELGLQKNISKIRKDQLQLSKDLNSFVRLRNKLVNEGAQLNSDIVISLNDQIKFTKNLQVELERVEKLSNNIANNSTVKRFSSIANFLKSFGSPLKGFATPFEKGAEAARESIVTNTEILKTGKGLTAEKMKELGLADRLNGIYGEYGLRVAKLTDEEKEAAIQRAASRVSAYETFKIYSNLATNVLGVSLLNSLFKVNKAQTEFRRLTGQSVKIIDTLNTSLTTTVDYINQATDATTQFGINATALFSNANLTEATELTKLIGLSSEESNNLALAVQSVGGSLDDNVESAISQVNAVNAARKSAVSQKTVLQDVAKVSSGLTVAFGGQVDLLAEAAAEARALGLNLSQIEKIADGLLDIETSIKNEFVAETILGEELELGRARFYAQTDNVLGLVQELRKNEGLLNGFIRGGKIERQAAADALGISVEEMGKFVLLNQAQLGISTQAAAAAAGVTEEQMKQLTLQETFNKSIEKLTSFLVGGLEPALAAIANNFTTMGAILGTLAGLSLAKLITQLAAAAVQAGLIKAFVNPTGLLIGLGALTAVLAIAGGMAASYAKNSASKVEDGFADSSSGPFEIKDKFGRRAITTPGDNLAVSPNVALTTPNPNLTTPNSNLTTPTRNTRNESSAMQLDYNKLADAIAKGAERGTSNAKLALNVDGRKFADSQQVPGVLGQYKFSS
jgi:hypothetical protein